MLSKVETYRSLDDLYTERYAVAAHWKVIAHTSTWMLLCGYLLLLTTFDKDPQLRISYDLIIVLLVGLLAGGYSFTVLLWFACRSNLFRLECILLPSASCSLFGFLACGWALITSSRFDPRLAGSVVTLLLTIMSTAVYGIIAVIYKQKIRKATSNLSWRNSHDSGSWHESAHYLPYGVTTFPSMERGRTYSNPSPGETYRHHIGMTEDDMVKFQMARLLNKVDKQQSPDPTATTFRIDWPGADFEEEQQQLHSRGRSGSGAFLTPGDATRYGRGRANSDGAFARIGQVIGLGDRGRRERREQEEAAARAKSREERRRQIELASLHDRRGSGDIAER